MVTDPAVQFVHDVFESLSESAVPAEHCVHAVAPLSFNVFVVDPALQVAHALVDALLYWPATQAVHVVAFVLLRVFVTDPAEHSAQLVCPTFP